MGSEKILERVITKSNYLSFLQCKKKLWLEKYAPEKAKAVSTSQQYFIEEGERVEKLAKSLFTNAIGIDRNASITKRLKQTEETINSGSPTIFEASFLVNQCFAAADILQKTKNGWRLIEVKATNNIDKKHLQDVAFQFHVLKQSGLAITDVSIMYLNKNTEWQGKLTKDVFIIDSVAADIQPYLLNIEENICKANSILKENGTIDEKLCRICFQNGVCSFQPHCWQHINKPTIFDIPLHWKHRDKFTDQNILLLEDISDDIELRGDIRSTIERGKNHTVDINESAIMDWLNALSFPLYFLDFETYGPAIPIFKGMKPYQRIPFQFSCHILEENGNLQHKEFLHEQNSDPRKAFVEALTKNIGPAGSVIVYHKSFEAGVLKELQLMSSDQQAANLESYVNRLADLEDIFKNHYIHHAFNGSTSIKAVLPILCPELSYKNLEIQKGDQASIAWLDIINGIDKQKTVENLKEYCELDTYAMLAIYNMLIKSFI